MKKSLFKPYHRYLSARSFEAYKRRRTEEKKPLGLHMGCGDQPIDGWFNCDVARISGQVNYVDATDRLPFDDDCLDFVFSEHFVEHLPLEQGVEFFREAHRVLKPGGVLRTATPSLTFVRDLLDRRTPAHGRYVEWCAKSFLPGRPVEAAAVVNHLFYGWGHRFIYDAAILQRVLREIGYHDFSEHSPGRSAHAGLAGLEQHGNSVPPEFNELETLVLEAVR